MHRLCIKRYRNTLIPLREAWYSKTSSTFGNDEKTRNLVYKDALEMLRSHFEFAVRDSVPRKNAELYEAVKHFDDLCYHVGPKRLVYTSDILMISYKSLEQPKNLTVDNLRRAAMLSWAFENATTGFFLADDITDSNTVRWNMPCWHTLPHIGLRALVDLRLLTMGSSQIIRKHLKDLPTYIHLQTLFNQFLYVTFLGQSSDLYSSSLFKNYRDDSSLSMSHYRALTKMKVGFPLYVAPPLAAIYLANLDPEIYTRSKHIFDNLAIHRQAQVSILVRTFYTRVLVL
ncbi:hypothetical protein RI129_010603 [Pyrocoelia pectoralis]|uniref:Terpene synthase n=1 Tax=Pyrocoelia pectoralis TaxID=417401 RepID=A0AAN7V273_9COLE